jgi:uncharacterized metal-binding protein
MTKNTRSTIFVNDNLIATDNSPLPLVYSCSGCSNIAQLANQLAIELDRENLAEMSCIAGVGGGVKKLVKLAQSGRPIIALDGCALHCVKHCLEKQGVSATHHFTLSEFGLKKHYKTDFQQNELRLAKENVLQSLDKIPIKPDR